MQMDPIVVEQKVFKVMREESKFVQIKITELNEEN